MRHLLKIAQELESVLGKNLPELTSFIDKIILYRHAPGKFFEPLKNFFGVWTSFPAAQMLAGELEDVAITKAEIIETLYDQLGFQKAQYVDLVESLLEIIKTDLAAGNDVLISGFGKFQVKEKGERRGRDPSTDQDLMIRPRRVVTFKISGKLKKRLNEE